MSNISPEKLMALGLKPNETAVYLALLELGTGSVTAISHRAGLNRTTGYDILERLALYGIVNRPLGEGKKQTYVVEPPSRLKIYLENKKRRAEERLKELDGLLPGLELLYKTDLKPVIKFAEGKTEMVNMYLHKLDSREPIRAILNLKGYSEDFDEMGQASSAARYKKGIAEKVLAIKNETALSWWEKVYQDKPKLQANTEYRWLAPEAIKELPNGEVNIYNDTTLIMLTKPGEYVAFEITSQSLASFLKIIFDLAWSQVKD
ncbi:MAG: helix-turn-helix domain-containing protein [Patescibacteria group bacterium]|jgi:sugar-specific transcriptional regulator TrmB